MRRRPPRSPLFPYTTLFRSHKGRIAIGKIYNGTLNVGEQVTRISRGGTLTKTTISTLATFVGLEKVDVKTAEAGDIVAVSGNAEITIGETLTDVQNPAALQILKVRSEEHTSE